jgi:hypothetical protein
MESLPQCQAPEPAGAAASSTGCHSSRRLKRTFPWNQGEGFQNPSTWSCATRSVSKSAFE